MSSHPKAGVDESGDPLPLGDKAYLHPDDWVMLLIFYGSDIATVFLMPDSSLSYFVTNFDCCCMLE